MREVAARGLPRELLNGEAEREQRNKSLEPLGCRRESEARGVMMRLSVSESGDALFGSCKGVGDVSSMGAAEPTWSRFSADVLIGVLSLSRESARQLLQVVECLASKDERRLDWRTR